MVSTIIAQEMYNRLFILLTTVFMFGVQQTNLRAFYKKLYGVIPNSQNDTLLWLGTASCVSLPLIGIFDEHLWPLPHGLSAIVFFLTFGLYSVKLGRALYAHRDKYPDDEQPSIQRLYTATHWITYSLGALLLSIIVYHSKSPTPFFEWSVVLYYVNFFSIASFDNPFYNTVHQPGEMTPLK